MLAAEANDIEALRGEGVSCRLGGEVTACIDLGCIGEEDMDLEGGKELRSGGAMERNRRYVSSGDMRMFHGSWTKVCGL